MLITHLCNPVIHKSPFWVRKISYQFLYFPLYCFDCCFLWLQFLTKTLQKCAYAILKFINIRQNDILVIFKTFCHYMVISTDYEIVCIAKIGCLSLKHLGTLKFGLWMRNRNFYQRCGVPLITKQNIHTHIVLILFLWDIRVFFNAITGGNSNWVKFTCKFTCPRQRYLISFFF